MALPVKSTETKQQLEQRLRAHPVVAPKPDHKQDMFAADAWEGSATAEQVKIASVAELKKKQ